MSGEDDLGAAGQTSDVVDAIDLALDELLGPRPTALVEERPEPKDPSAENEAKAHLYRSVSRPFGLG